MFVMATTGEDKISTSIIKFKYVCTCSVTVIITRIGDYRIPFLLLWILVLLRQGFSLPGGTNKAHLRQLATTDSHVPWV